MAKYSVDVQLNPDVENLQKTLDSQNLQAEVDVQLTGFENKPIELTADPTQVQETLKQLDLDITALSQKEFDLNADAANKALIDLNESMNNFFEKGNAFIEVRNEIKGLSLETLTFEQGLNTATKLLGAFSRMNLNDMKKSFQDAGSQLKTVGTQLKTAGQQFKAAFSKSTFTATQTGFKGIVTSMKTVGTAAKGLGAAFKAALGPVGLALQALQTIASIATKFEAVRKVLSKFIEEIRKLPVVGEAAAGIIENLFGLDSEEFKPLNNLTEGLLQARQAAIDFSKSGQVLTDEMKTGLEQELKRIADQSNQVQLSIDRIGKGEQSESTTKQIKLLNVELERLTYQSETVQIRLGSLSELDVQFDSSLKAIDSFQEKLNELNTTFSELFDDEDNSLEKFRYESKKQLDQLSKTFKTNLDAIITEIERLDKAYKDAQASGQQMSQQSEQQYRSTRTNLTNQLNEARRLAEEGIRVQEQIIQEQQRRLENQIRSSNPFFIDINDLSNNTKESLKILQDQYKNAWELAKDDSIQQERITREFSQRMKSIINDFSSASLGSVNTLFNQINTKNLQDISNNFGSNLQPLSNDIINFIGKIKDSIQPVDLQNVIRYKLDIQTNMNGLDETKKQIEGLGSLFQNLFISNASFIDPTILPPPEPKDITALQNLWKSTLIQVTDIPVDLPFSKNLIDSFENNLTPTVSEFFDNLMKTFEDESIVVQKDYEDLITNIFNPTKLNELGISGPEQQAKILSDLMNVYKSIQGLKFNENLQKQNLLWLQASEQVAVMVANLSKWEKAGLWILENLNIIDVYPQFKVLSDQIRLITRDFQDSQVSLRKQFIFNEISYSDYYNGLEDLERQHIRNLEDLEIQKRQIFSETFNQYIQNFSTIFDQFDPSELFKFGGEVDILRQNLKNLYNSVPQGVDLIDLILGGGSEEEINNINNINLQIEEMKNQLNSLETDALGFYGLKALTISVSQMTQGFIEGENGVKSFFNALLDGAIAALPALLTIGAVKTWVEGNIIAAIAAGAGIIALITGLKAALAFEEGGLVPGKYIGGDSVPAILTPGEFVSKRSVARKYSNQLNYLNQTGSWPQQVISTQAIEDKLDIQNKLLSKGIKQDVQLYGDVRLKNDIFGSVDWSKQRAYK